MGLGISPSLWPYLSTPARLRCRAVLGGSCDALRRWASILIGWVAFPALSNAADIETAGIEASQPGARSNSLLFFSGRMSTTDIYSTMALNLIKPPGQNYDNYVAGVAYNRDIINLGYSFHLGAEVGVADRFGRHKQCCDPIIRSSSIVHSAEVWGGAHLRYTGFTLFDAVRVGFGVTFGLSAVNSSIGSEARWAAQNFSTNHLLYYFGPELGIAFLNTPNFELVIRLHHRSGGKTVPFLPTIADRGEGYNASVAGIRYFF
jgi:hypothetical protein